MQRDLDLIRKILLRLESSNAKATHHPTPPEGCGEEQFEYHMEILAEAGFIKMNRHETYDGVSYEDCRLTWSGHEYLDAVRDSNVWNKVKEEAAQLESVPVAVIRDIALAAIRTLILGS